MDGSTFSTPTPPTHLQGQDMASRSLPCGDGALPILPPASEPSAAHKPAFARRGIGHNANGGTHQTTFVSTDRADERSVGWFHGYVEDGAVWNGYVLTHVGEPSWRCSAPVMVLAERAA